MTESARCMQMIAQRLIDLEAVLPGVDLSRLTARYPAILLEHSVDGIRNKLQALRCFAAPVSSSCTMSVDGVMCKSTVSAAVLQLAVDMRI